MNEDGIHKCCAEIITAGAEIELLQRDTVANLEESRRWRMAHETSNSDAFNRLFTRLDSIDDKLANRVQPWIVWVFAIGGGAIGSLLTIIATLVTHFI
jgi:hypothetical protein